MTNEEQAKAEAPEIDETKSLDEFKSAELTEEDAKIVKKRSKKLGIDKEVVEKARIQEKNFKAAQGLIVHFSEKLQDLGFVLEAVIKYAENGIRPAFDLRPMNIDELKTHELKLKSKAAAAMENAHAETEPKPEEPVAEPANLAA